MNSCPGLMQAAKHIVTRNDVTKNAGLEDLNPFYWKRTGILHSTGFPPTWKVRESQGKSGNLGGQGKSGKSQGILDGVREKEEKKKKCEKKEHKIKKEREIHFMALITLKKK